MGLAIGIACCLLIVLWILDEMSYDRFHKDADQIYQVLTHGTIPNNTTTPIPFAPVFRDAFPEVIYASRYEGFDDALLSRGDIAFYENGIQVVDPDFFRIFSFSFLMGDRNTALKEPYSIVISAEMAAKYFPGEDPLGKTLTVNNRRDLGKTLTVNNRRDFTVTGVIKNVPRNSTLSFDMAIPYEIKIRMARERSGLDPTSWGWWSPNTFLKIGENVPFDAFNSKIADFLQRHGEDEDARISVLPFAERNFFFWDTKTYITIYSLIAVFILMVACINFMNLSTARSANRASEIGIRKVNGAIRKHLIIQFLSESFMMVFASLIVGLMLALLLLPLFNAVTGKQLSMEALRSWSIIPIFVGLLLCTGLAAGSYPALFLSSFQPAQVLKGKLKAGSGGSMFRNILVVMQFAISVILIIGSGIVYKQLNFLKTTDVGYVKERVINISLEGDSRRFYEPLKNRMLADERILGVTGTADDLPYFGWGTSTTRWEGKNPDKDILVNFNIVDYDFIETLGIEMAEGRPFSREFTSDVENGIIVNEEMVSLMGLESAVGAKLVTWEKPRTIVGVIKDCHFQPLTNLITPYFFYLEKERITNLVIRMQSGKIPATLQFIKNVWEDFVPMYPFEYGFVDEDFNNTYRGIERAGRLASSFTFIAIFIACLGLFGLASFTAEQRSKEIGIRKVLGSSVPGIVVLLSKEFIKWVLIANIVAWPVAWFVMNLWLQGFAYQSKIGLGIFVVSGLLAILIALLTVSYQALKAAMANPVDALMYE
jgi:ABC-type antimicrobial peptide transport system permease subunit